MVKDDRKYHLHILDCISRIGDDVRDGRAAFDATHMIQDAVIRNLQVMTESTQRLSLERSRPNIHVHPRSFAAKIFSRRP